MVLPSPVWSRPSKRPLAAVRAELERQRAFRLEQLAQLGTADEADGALREIRAALADGARKALADIELALARMDEGTYGRCRVCGGVITPAVLTAIPATTLCEACHPARAEGVA
ncbi:hypothetical protein [Pseudonocardia zijingensis]|uniref:TraR/DksA family transcriptional regulator n=1 Tax=Pseudonocardia zijingensis TaxID=153376 RepID=A0ABP4A954_9PSEU